MSHRAGREGMQGIEGNHASGEAAERYVLGRATDAECENLEHHLLICQQCRQEVAEFEQFLTSFRSVAPLLEAEDRKHFVWMNVRERIRLPSLAFAASALAILIVGIPYWQTERLGLPLQTVELQPVRAAAEARVSSGGPLLLRLPLPDPGAGRVRADVISSSGSIEVSALLRVSGSGPAELPLPDGLAPGQYWIRLFPEGGSRLTREFGLLVD